MHVCVHNYAEGAIFSYVQMQLSSNAFQHVTNFNHFPFLFKNVDFSDIGYTAQVTIINELV